MNGRKPHDGKSAELTDSRFDRRLAGVLEHAARIFCEKCGTPLFARNEKLPQYLAVKVGSLDEPSVFEPQANIWIKSAQPWHHLDAAISRFKENPELGARAILEFFRSSAVKLSRLIRRRGDYGAAGQARAGEPGQGRPAGK